VTATQTVGNPTVVSAAGGANTGNGTLGTLTAKGYALASVPTVSSSMTPPTSL